MTFGYSQARFEGSQLPQKTQHLMIQMIDLNVQSNPDFQDYEVMSAQFILARAGGGVSEAQGAIYGLLCNNIPANDDSAWLSYVLDDRENESCKPLVQSLQHLYARCDTVLRNPADGFWVLLPKDDAPVLERTVALAAWCRGFLLGLLGPGNNRRQFFQGEAKELVDDLLAISEVEYEGVDDALVSENSESDERSLFEIQEYVQVAVQYLYEITAPNPPAPKPSAPKPLADDTNE